MNKELKNYQTNDFGMGKMPPYDKEIEKAVLGRIMLEPQAFDIANELLTADAFYLQIHQTIYKACVNLQNKMAPCDMLMVAAELVKMQKLEEIGGGYYLAELTKNVTGEGGIEYHSKVVLQKFFHREMIRIAADALHNAYDESNDIFELIDKADGQIVGITSKHLRGGYTDALTLAVEARKRVDMIRENKQMITGVPTGFKPLTAITNGWQETDLIILAARPSVGKTAFALNLARNAMRDPVKPTKVGFFSLEMSGAQLMQRLIACDGDIRLDEINTGRFNYVGGYDAFCKAADKAADLPIFIDATPALTIIEFKSKARRLVNKQGVGLIIIDYLQLMSGKTDGDVRMREQEISLISRTLKSIAKELKVPIIALSQLSRALEKEKRDPQLSDLRESGAIEQDADLVAFLTRINYQKKEGEIDPAIKDDAKLWIKKHRNGTLENILFKTDLSLQKWYDLDDWNRAKGVGNWVPVPTNSYTGTGDVNEDLPF